MQHPHAYGYVADQFFLTGQGWVLMVRLSDLQGEVFLGDVVLCANLETRRTIKVKGLDLPRKQGEPVLGVVVGQLRETLIRPLLHQHIYFSRDLTHD